MKKWLDRYDNGGGPVKNFNMPNSQQYIPTVRVDNLRAPVVNEPLTFMQQWLNSPMHNEMLDNSLSKTFSGSLISRLLKNSYLDSYKDDRQKKLHQSFVKYYDKRPENVSPRTGADANHLTHEIRVFNKDSNVLRGILTHEKSHMSDYGGSNIPFHDIKLIESYLPKNIEETPYYKSMINSVNSGDVDMKDVVDWVNYVTRPTETRARLNDLREKAFNKKIYNPLNQRITPAQYKKLIDSESLNKSGFNPLNHLKSVYTDDQIINMLNTISKNENSNDISDNTSDEIYTAKNGGWLDRYDKGGSVKKLKPSEIADIKKFIANNADTEDINDPRYYTGKPVVNKAYNVTNRLSAGNLPRYVDPNVKNDPALKWVNAASMLGPIGVIAAPEIAAGAAALSPYLSAPLVVGGTELAAVTPASVAGAYFAHEGYKKLPQTQASVLNAYNNPTRQNILNAANDVGWNTMDFLGTGEAIKGATQLAEPIINKAGKAVVNQLSRLPFNNVPLLNQASKFNPWKYRQREGMMYRGLGEEGMKDAIESRLFRAKQNVVPEYYPGTRLRVNKEFGSVYFTPKFNTAATYGDNYLAEVPKDVAEWIQRYKRSEWSQFSKDPIPIDKGRILKKNWLLGYTPLEIPNNYEEGGESINIINTPGSLNIMDRPENRKGNQNVFNRAASFLEYQNKMNSATPVSLNPRVAKQNQIITSLPTNGKNYAIVDKKADSIFYFTPEGRNITGEPVITGASRNDIDKGLSMKEWAAQTGDNNHEHYFEYLKQNGLQTTPSGIFHLTSLRTDVAKDPNKYWRAFNNAVRPERAEHVFESRIKDYGPRQLMFTFSDENNKPSSKAIHGTAREERLNAFNNLEKDRGLSNGCINVNGKTICFNALETGSNLYVLPEKSDKYLYPQKKMDVNTLSPLNEYYENGGDTTDYNFLAWQLADPIRASYHVVNPKDFHGPDQYKYPNHMTFSDESMYSTPEHMGGHWTELKNGKWQFQPSQWNIQNAGGKEKFLNWWNQGEGKEGNKVKFDYGGSFGSAFAQARKDLGAGKVFSWNGKQYTTNFAEEDNSVSSDVPVKRYTAPVRQPELIDNNAEMANIADQRMQYYNQQKKKVVPIPYPVPVKSETVSNKKPIVNNPFLNLTAPAQPNPFANLKPSYDNLVQFAYNPVKETVPVKKVNSPITANKDNVKLDWSNISLAPGIPYKKTDNEESNSLNVRLFINGIKRNISKLFGDDESSATKLDLSKAKANVTNKTILGNKPIAPPEFENTYDVPRITGDTLWDDKNTGVYHMPMIVDLNQQSFGHRSRNDRTDVKSPGYLFGAIDDSRNFRHFVNAKTSQLDPDQFYSGVDPTTNKIRIQKGKWFQGKNIDVLPHQGFENVVALAKDKKNKFVLKSSSAAADGYWSPQYIHSDNTVYGSPGLLMHKHQKDAGYYGNITGGNVVLTTPDFKRQIYVSGSVNDINNAIEQFKKTTGSKVINAVTVDNGSFARNYLKANNHISAEDWYMLDQRNTSGGLGYYMLPGKKDGGQIHNWREVEVPHKNNQLSGWLDKL